MASIAILAHKLDRIIWRRADGNGYNCPYLIGRMAFELIRRGHQVEIVHGLQAKNANPDLAVLHVDLTRVPDEYLAFAAGFRNCLNVKVADIAKTAVSDALLDRQPDWNGPVIVKSNLNCNGGSEAAKAALRAGHAPKPAPAPDYRVFKSIHDVPDALRRDPELVIDRFLPEREGEFFAIRHWVFCGDREFCSRYVSAEPIIKGSNVIRREPVPVPEALRRKRTELGFDYGKFDLVMHDGECVLFDANKTPGSPPPLALADGIYVATLCDGLESHL